MVRIINVIKKPAWASAEDSWCVAEWQNFDIFVSHSIPNVAIPSTSSEYGIILSQIGYIESNLLARSDFNQPMAKCIPLAQTVTDQHTVWHSQTIQKSGAYFIKYGADVK